MRPLTRDRRPRPTGPIAWAASAAVAGVLVLSGCGDDDMDPDPGAPGGTSEIDGSETGTDSGTSSSTSVDDGTGGSTTSGGTEGNEIAPGDTTDMTAQDTDEG